MSPPLFRRNCVKAKSPVKNRPPPPLPTEEPMDDLIVLDESESSKGEKGVKSQEKPVHNVPILNPKVVEQAPVISKSSKMAANFDGLSDSSKSNVSSVPLLKPQKSAQEPTVSKSVPKPVEKKVEEEPKKGGKKADSFSFVDDLLAQHKTKNVTEQTMTRSNSKHGNKMKKPPSSSNSVEEKAGVIKTDNVNRSNSEPDEREANNRKTRAANNRDQAAVGKKDTIAKVTVTDADLEFSSSPTY